MELFFLLVHVLSLLFADAFVFFQLEIIIVVLVLHSVVELSAQIDSHN